MLCFSFSDGCCQRNRVARISITGILTSLFKVWHGVLLASTSYRWSPLVEISAALLQLRLWRGTGRTVPTRLRTQGALGLTVVQWPCGVAGHGCCRLRSHPPRSSPRMRKSLPSAVRGLADGARHLQRPCAALHAPAQGPGPQALALGDHIRSGA